MLLRGAVTILLAIFSGMARSVTGRVVVQQKILRVVVDVLVHQGGDSGGHRGRVLDDRDTVAASAPIVAKVRVIVRTGVLGSSRAARCMARKTAWSLVVLGAAHALPALSASGPRAAHHQLALAGVVAQHALLVRFACVLITLLGILERGVAIAAMSTHAGRSEGERAKRKTGGALERGVMGWGWCTGGIVHDDAGCLYCFYSRNLHSSSSHVLHRMYLTIARLGMAGMSQ